MHGFQAVIPAKAGIHHYSDGLVVLDAGSSPASRENFGLSSWQLFGHYPGKGQDRGYPKCK